MDIDTKDDDVIDTAQIANDIQRFVRRTFDIPNPLLYFVRKSDGSESYHVYGNFATTLSMMKHIVKDTSKYIDMQVYKNNTSLRMCGSYKYNIKDKTTVKTYYDPIGVCSFKDTIISNIEGLYVIKPNIGLIKQPHYHIESRTHTSCAALNPIIKDKLDEVLGPSNYTLKQTDKYNICIIKNSYVCPSNESIRHESQNAIIYTKSKGQNIEYYLKCYSQKCNKSNFLLGSVENKTMSAEDILKGIINKNPLVLDDGLIPTQCNRYLQFEQSELKQNQLICIRSPMGSGKTHCITQTFKPDSKVLYISTRITFTQSLSSKYNMMSYLDAQDAHIPLAFSNDHKKWMVQIDSLHLFRNVSQADIIVVDEIESLLDQITICKNQFEVFKAFIDMLNVNTTTYVMDAMLTMSTINLVTTLGNREPYEIVYNNYKPMDDHTIKINKLHKSWNL